MTAATLFLLPFAGGNAYSYRPLVPFLPGWVRTVPLEPPGRGRRFSEPPLAGIEEMAADAVSRMRPHLEGPFALFGHSMGGLLAYLVAKRLEREGLPLPSHLFVSGKGPPHLASREAGWHQLPPEEFRSRLKGLGGCADAVLDDPELFAYFAPVIRGDMRAVADYRHAEQAPLGVPVTVMIGNAERTTFEDASRWKETTSSRFRLLQFEGGHFFLFDHAAKVGAEIGAALEGL